MRVSTLLHQLHAHAVYSVACSWISVLRVRRVVATVGSLALVACADPLLARERADGVFAVVELPNRFVTTPTSYRVYVQVKASNARKIEVLRIDKAEVPEVLWLDERSLSIVVPCGQVHSFSDFAIVQLGGELEKIPVTLNNFGLCSPR